MHIERAQPGLGTLLQIAFDLPQHCLYDAEKIIELTFAAGQVVHDLMTVHVAHSELNQLNQRGHLEPQQVHAYIWHVLKVAKQLYELSQGVFDPAKAGFYLLQHHLLHDFKLNNATEQGSMGDIEFLPNRRIFFKQPLYLDLGGIAKGFAVDIMLHTLKRCGIVQACINAGGDLRTMGPKPLLLHIRDPITPTLLYPLGNLWQGACATSGHYFSQAQAPSHLINATTLLPFEQSSSLTVLAPSAIIADGLTKILVAQSTPDIIQHCLTRFNAQAIDLKITPENAPCWTFY